MSQITIMLSSQTIIALNELGYALYVMRAFDTTNRAGKPLVWLTTTQFFENIAIAFEVKYDAYVSVSQIIGGGIVVATSVAPAALGETATVDGNGIITVTQGGSPTAVTLVNGSTREYTAGLAAAANNGGAAPIFAEPLFGLAEDIAAPLDQFLLTFSTQGIAAGAVVTHAMSQSLLVDLAGADQRSVVFDINTGWSWEGPWANTVPAGAELTPILVHERPLQSAVRA